MKRALVIASVALVLVFGFLALDKTRRASTPAPQAPSSLSTERKEAIRRFWQVYGQATQLRVKGEWAATIPPYQEALELNPHHEDTLYYLGNMLFEAGRYEEAVSLWRRLLVLNPSSTRALVQLGTLYSCGAPGAPFDLERAERAFEKTLAINKEESGPVLRLGEIALLKGDRSRALEYLRAGSRSNFKSVAAHYLVGYLEWLEGERPAALKALRQAVEFSRGIQPEVSASSEGDTRKGKPLLAAGARPRSLLAPFWSVLEGWEGEVSAARMEREYQRLEQMLEELQ